ncbi:MAG: hypothetical protein R2746_07935 [Acidimicrobiales bacterium]
MLRGNAAPPATGARPTLAIGADEGGVAVMRSKRAEPAPSLDLRGVDPGRSCP